jgi:hypothetical protein
MKTASTLLAFVAMFLFAGTAFAQNGSTTTRGTECGSFYNPCCNEWVELCYDYNVVIGKNGNMQHINAQGTGTSAGGTNYNFTASIHQNTNLSPNGAGEMTYAVTENFISPGNPDCNFRIHAIWHVTMNANGTITVTVERTRFECQNGTEIS